MAKFHDRLLQPGALVADGATGTMIQKAGLPRGTAPERWNLENQEAVRALHQGYFEAGADIVLTNTFGGTRIRLEKDQLGERAEEINRVAAQLARQVAGQDRLVFGDIGPIGKLLKPYGPLLYNDAAAAFAEQAKGLSEGGADAILVETMADLNEVKAAVEGVRKVCDLPLLVTMSFDSHGCTMMGVKPADAIRELLALKVDVGGANCGRTLTETLSAIQAMRQAAPETTLMAKPNAGLPHISGNDTVFDVTPETMAEYALKFRDAGVKIFGGCCGSTPEHIRAVANALHS
ncbi:MAG: homocysteine S-methyltransferase family protein [Omnitrophica WOR_2 bacterium]